MGRRATLRWCIALAAERLLADNLMGHRGLLPQAEARILRSQARHEPNRRRGPP